VCAGRSIGVKPSSLRRNLLEAMDAREQRERRRLGLVRGQRRGGCRGMMAGGHEPV
jgi:hypothetical protein